MATLGVEREDVDEACDHWNPVLVPAQPGAPGLVPEPDTYCCRALSMLEWGLLRRVVLAADEVGTGSADGLEVDVHANWSEASCCRTPSCQYQAFHAGPCGPAAGEPLPVEQVLLLDARASSVEPDEPCFLVKWQGWDVATFCTWEPVAHMRSAWPEKVGEWQRDGSPALYVDVE